MKGLDGRSPTLAVVFASRKYEDVDEVVRAVHAVTGPVAFVGGTSGGRVLGPRADAPFGVSVVLLGGDDLDVSVRSVEVSSTDLLEVVPIAEEIARDADEAASRGYENYACLVFAPGLSIDGECLAAAVRKGAGARAQLAGGLTGDDLAMDDRALVIAEGELRSAAVVLCGIFSKRAIGIAARHGSHPVGPIRTVTRMEGRVLVSLDDRPALDVWLEDARQAGAEPPADNRDVAFYLANHYDLGIVPGPLRQSSPPCERELVARAPQAIADDGGVTLSASIAEGTHVRVMNTKPEDSVRAAREAAALARSRVDGPIAGALVFPCSGRLATGPAFAEEISTIRHEIGAPIGGSCVYGEIARNVSDADAFFNSTTVIVAFGGPPEAPAN
ncbi:hypothetical protein AKJ09_01241 [Labilithrix luteola]|uniref:FIST C-domain domain-containing protein n=1 Tax=Labilithrix luteola TaxID=1391654 RepID=A0A0K1PM27_9BACT|nr:FIST N-terminal domain-containing protein [Labilithrix luteola]AKU94577.1 hypothetical protein AKJ09_01241 [Labilithrix luteola]